MIASFGADQLESLLQAYEDDESLEFAVRHRAHFALAEVEVVSFNRDQGIVIVGQSVTKHIRQTATFLRGRGLQVTSVECFLSRSRTVRGC